MVYLESCHVDETPSCRTQISTPGSWQKVYLRGGGRLVTGRRVARKARVRQRRAAGGEAVGSPCVVDEVQQHHAAVNRGEDAVHHVENGFFPRFQSSGARTAPDVQLRLCEKARSDREDADGERQDAGGLLRRISVGWDRHDCHGYADLFPPSASVPRPTIRIIALQVWHRHVL